LASPSTRNSAVPDLLDCARRLLEEVVIGGSHEDEAGNPPRPKIVRDRSFRERRRPGCLKGSGVIGDPLRSAFIGNADAPTPPALSTTPSAPLARAAAKPTGLRNMLAVSYIVGPQTAAHNAAFIQMQTPTSFSRTSCTGCRYSYLPRPQSLKWSRDSYRHPTADARCSC
jgi:hypothetical protein